MSKCKTQELNKLAKRFNGSKGTCLSMFFSAKAHKEGIPFRCIVSVKGSWQRELSRYLQKHLNTLNTNDPFAVRNSPEVIDFVRKSGDVGGLFFVDVEELLFSIPHGELLTCVQECIEGNGATRFQNAAGISVSGFLSLLEFYLSARVVKHDDKLYIQKKGICIGSCVALVLSSIFVSRLDRNLLRDMDNGMVQKIFRHVDDYLIVLKRREGLSYQGSIAEVLQTFSKLGGSLKFTHEMQKGHNLRFLDIDF